MKTRWKQINLTTNYCIWLFCCDTTNACYSKIRRIHISKLEYINYLINEIRAWPSFLSKKKWIISMNVPIFLVLFSFFFQYIVKWQHLFPFNIYFSTSFIFYFASFSCMNYKDLIVIVVYIANICNTQPQPLLPRTSFALIPILNLGFWIMVQIC